MALRDLPSLHRELICFDRRWPWRAAFLAPFDRHATLKTMFPTGAAGTWPSIGGNWRGPRPICHLIPR